MTDQPDTAPERPPIHVSIDIETLGTAPGSIILAIAAVAFRESDGAEVSHLDLRVDPDSCTALGLTCSAATLRFWLTEATAEARADVLRTPASSIDIAVVNLRYWLTSGLSSLGSVEGIWGWPAAFDLPLLSAAWARRKGRTSDELFDHRLARCGRTLSALTGIKPDRDCGVHHTPLDDARAQATAIHRSLKLVADWQREARLKASLAGAIEAEASSRIVARLTAMHEHLRAGEQLARAEALLKLARPYVETCAVPALVRQIDAALALGPVEVGG